MGNLRNELDKVSTTLEGSRIAKDTRQELDNRLGALKSRHGKLPVSVDHVPSPLVDDDWYGARYYWGSRYNDRADARLATPASAAVRAVNIDHVTEYDLERRSTPSAWSPRVEVTIGANDRLVTGDLTANEARRLALHLLAAADLLEH